MDQSFNLEGKIAVITGGGGVLAGTVAESLVQAGVKIALLDLRGEQAEQKAAALRAKGGTVIGWEANVLDPNSLEKVKTEILAQWGRVDILLNAAGGNQAGATIMPDQTIFDVDLKALAGVMDLNFQGTVIPSLVFGKQMAEQKQGVIINFSSMTVSRALTRVVGYSAGKAAMENFTRWMAVEMAKKFGEGIRVNAIAPGFFIGDQNRRLLLNEDGSLTARGETIIRQTPMGRFGEAEEINGTIHWLASEAARFITGVVIPIDGGFSAFSGV